MPPPPPAGLEQNRIAQAIGLGDGMLGAFESLAAGQNRHIGRHGGRARGDLVAHGADGLHGRPHEEDVFGSARSGEIGVFRKETVARMHRASLGLDSRLQDRIYVEVALVGWRGPQTHRFVGFDYMQGVGVSLGINRHRGQTQPLGGTNDTSGDFAPVGDEKLANHGASFVFERSAALPSRGTLFEKRCDSLASVFGKGIEGQSRPQIVELLRKAHVFDGKNGLAAQG